MKYLFSKIIALLCPALLVACQPDSVPANLDGPALYERFHGKYSIISSTSSVAVDINADGHSSTDLLLEIPALGPDYWNYLELRIIVHSKRSGDADFLFSQSWPEQEIFIHDSQTQRWEGEYIAYQPDLTVNYSMQGRGRIFTFSPDLKSLIITPNDEKDTRDVHRWTLPDSVTILDSAAEPRIQIINRRRFYTSEGVKEVLVTTIYQRFTMVT